MPPPLASHPDTPKVCTKAPVQQTLPFRLPPTASRDRREHRAEDTVRTRTQRKKQSKASEVLSVQEERECGGLGGGGSAPGECPGGVPCAERVGPGCWQHLTKYQRISLIAFMAEKFLRTEHVQVLVKHVLTSQLTVKLPLAFSVTANDSYQLSTQARRRRATKPNVLLILIAQTFPLFFQAVIKN